MDAWVLGASSDFVYYHFKGMVFFLSQVRERRNHDMIQFYYLLGAEGDIIKMQYWYCLSGNGKIQFTAKALSSFPFALFMTPSLPL
jgi:hypothetical protein